MDELWHQLARVIVTRRIEKGWTQSELAKRAGVHRVTICNLESAKVKELGFSKVQAILSQLDAEITLVTVGDFKTILRSNVLDDSLPPP